MAEQRAKIKQLLPHLYLIDDAGESVCYVIEGKTHAMVIDTANGHEDLQKIVRTLTNLPLIVVDTHGHPDHIFGNVYFDEAWLHPDDFALADSFFDEMKEGDQAGGLKPCPVKPLAIGQVFDLGELELEVVSLRGHTPGSIGLLDRKDRILFTGDGINTHLWMQLDGCSSIRELREMLIALKEKHGHEFDYILHGHDQGLRAAAPTIDQLIRGCDELLAGKTENDKPYFYFGNEALQHPLNADDPNQIIAYTKERL